MATWGLCFLDYEIPCELALSIEEARTTQLEIESTDHDTGIVLM